jgi:hypothetical protein
MYIYHQEIIYIIFHSLNILIIVMQYRYGTIIL